MGEEKDLSKSRNTPAAQSTPTLSRGKLFGIGAALLVVGLLVGWFGARALPQLTLTKNTTALETQQFQEVQSILKNSFDGNLDPQKQAQGALTGYVAALGDPYTTYLTPDQAKELADDLKGELSGIGIEVGTKKDRLTVISPIDGTPAAKAGLKAGDVIALIDGQDTSQITLDEAVKKIRGQKGTDVKLTILRGSEPPKEITVTRDTITVSSVSVEVKDGNVGYIRLRRFGDDTDDAIRKATADLAAKGINKVILDLRDNPGGYLNSAVSVSSEFLAEGTVVEERGKHIDTKKLTANPGGNLTNAKLIILINGGSASASEITAGALHDNKRAILVGEKSYGKGCVQEVKELSGGAQLKVTVANWYTPNGSNITKEGIKPDIEVKNTSEDSNAGRDPQLDRALQEAKQ